MPHSPIPRSWRSLSGLPLEGTRVTREAHIDDAGVDRKEPFFVVAGVVTNPDIHDAKIEDAMLAISKALRPDKPFVRLHACDIWQGSEEFSSKKYLECANVNDRRAKIDQLIELIGQHKAPVVFGICDKKTVWITPKHNRLPGRDYVDDVEVVAHAQAHLSCSVRLEYWMRKNLANEVARMIHEDIPRKKLPIEIAYNFCRDPDTSVVPVGWEPPISGMTPFVTILRSTSMGQPIWRADASIG